MREFAEQEIILPTGPYEGRRFSVARQPVAGLFLDAIDAGGFKRHAMTGPAQSGKSLIGFVIPTLYYLFEVKADVILGLPSMELAADKWRDDLLPVIERSRYRDQLPKRGSGSKGGKVVAVKFRNGRVLRFMSGGSKNIRSKTARVNVNTEIDVMQVPVGGSKEADPLRQLEARTKSFGSAARIFNECTVTTQDGRIWKEIQNGTNSMIEARCPKCSEYVAFEREHLVGWQDCKTILEAERNARLACPKCGSMLDDSDRAAAHRDTRLVHRNADTDTLGFRYNAANNLLVPLGDVAKKEWRALRMGDDEAETDLRQHDWAIPVEPENLQLTVTDWEMIAGRQGQWLRGVLPDDTEFLTLGADIGKYLIHWTAIAWRTGLTPHVHEYGTVEVKSDQLDENRAIELALCQLRDELAATGWSGQRPRRIFVDAGDWPDVIEPWCGKSHAIWPGVIWPCKGFGSKTLSPTGELAVRGWKAVPRSDGTLAVDLVADRWKSRTYQGIECPIAAPGALTVFKVDRLQDHLSFGKHITAEKKEEQLVGGKMKTVWVRVRRANHYLDSTALAIAAGITYAEERTPEQPATNQEPDAQPINPLNYRGRW